MKGKRGPTPDAVYKEPEASKPNGAETPATDLFAEPTPITRLLRVPLTVDEQHTLNAQAAVIAMQLVEQREIMALAKEHSKALELEQNAIVAKLRMQSRLADVSCRWEITLEANAKTLVRLDTNEAIETRPLSEEDRAEELKRVEAQNQRQAATA